MPERSDRTGTLVARMLAERARSVPRPVVLLDGRAGVGKSTIAAALAPMIGATLVHLDDMYPGWDGLQAAAAMVAADVLAPPEGPGRPDGSVRPGWRRWDWVVDRAAEWHQIDPAAPLVVEGCGALSRASASAATLRVWLTGDDRERRRRAIARDGDAFAQHWDRWARHEEVFIAAEHPEMLADIVVDTTGRASGEC